MLADAQKYRQLRDKTSAGAETTDLRVNSFMTQETVTMEEVMSKS